jgi:DEAD/DEAH box helicase domain-containing protein
MRDIVYFDLETQRSFGDVGGYAHKEKMGVSVGVAYSTRTGEYHIFDENQMDALITMLQRADLVVGYNHIDFDYAVLQKYTILNLEEATINLDMLNTVEEKLGHRLKLDAIASASVGVGKTADGLDALKWWQEYKKSDFKDIEPMMKIAEYCCYDVKCTKDVHEYGMKHGHVKYNDKTGNVSQFDVEWA